jgi:hypothetical protein
MENIGCGHHELGLVSIAGGGSSGVSELTLAIWLDSGTSCLA